MRPPLAIALMLTASLCAAGGVTAAPAAPLTKIEARTLPPETVKHRVVEQLDEILLPEPRHPPVGRPIYPLTDMMLRTRPHATRIAGLCESDSVLVEFGPAGQAADPADTPVKAVALQARHSFRFLAPPKSAEPEGRRWDDRAAADRQCARLDSNAQPFIEADEAGLAAQAAWLYLQVLAAVGQERRPFAVECAEGFDCARDLRRQAGLDSLGGAERCDGEPVKNIGCWSLTVGGDLWFELKVYATNGPDTTIHRVVVSEPIVVVDERVD